MSNSIKLNSKSLNNYSGTYGSYTLNTSNAASYGSNSTITTSGTGKISINYDPNLWTTEEYTIPSYTYTTNFCDIALVIRNHSLKEFTLRAILVDGSFDNEIDMVVDAILRTYKLSESFINDYYSLLASKQNCKTFLETQDLSEKFIESHLDDFKKYASLDRICKNQTLSIPFIERHFSEFSIGDICQMLSNNHIKLTLAFILKHKELISNREFLNGLGTKASYSKIFNKVIKMVDKYDVGYELDWNIISWSIDLDEDVLEEYIDKVDFNSLKLSDRKYKSDTINCFLGLIKK